MDELIARFEAREDGDLMLCETRGIAYQRDMKHRVSYDANYFNKCRGYEDQEIARKINAGRVALVDGYVDKNTRVVDIGIGSGEFIKHRENTFGYDVNPAAVQWLQRKQKFADDLSEFSAFTFWDVLEHVENPNHYFRHAAAYSHLFCCLPIFEDLKHIRESRHYRPGEHLYYFTRQGFIDWMNLYRFDLLETQDFETQAGRESIGTFAFQRSLPGYHETVGQYRKLHASAYGTSAWLYFDLIAKEVLAINPASILDYGCGRSDLAAHFWNEGRRRIAKYDPAIGAHEVMPEGKFDLVLCCDVMEHILMMDVERILREIHEKSFRVIFVISLRPARAKLPDGRNAHVTLLTDAEWMRWIKSLFGKAKRISTQWDHVLMVKTF